MRILFDSRDAAHKTPFGCIRTGQRCILRLFIPATCHATGVKLMLENCENAPAGEYPFIK